jgi:hypothetical protein
MAAPFLTSQAPRVAAKRRIAVSSVVPGASGYERSLRPRAVACSEGDC